MDAKDLRTGAALGDRSNDGNTKYAQGGGALPCHKNKAYQDIGSNTVGKVDAPAARPCAVIGPDRVVQPPAPSDAYLKKGPSEPWLAPDNTYRRPPDYPHKLLDYQHPSRNISPRQTFQENMQRIMVPPSYNAAKNKEDHNFLGETALSQMRNNKLNVPTDSNPKYCDVPYTVNPLSNDKKNDRLQDISVTNMNSVLARSAPQGWPSASSNVRPTKPYHQDMCQYPEYASCPGPRPMVITRPHRTVHEEPGPIYPDAYYHDGNIRFKPYPSPPVKERYPQPRYEYIGNYSNPFHPPPPFPTHKYELQKPLPPHPYSSYPQVPLKYLDSRMADPIMNGYQRSLNPQAAYNTMPFRNQVIHPTYGPVPGNCLPSNKYYPYPPDAAKAIPSNKLPYDGNTKMYPEYERNKNYPLSDLYINHPTKGPILPPNYPNVHSVHTHPYYRKELLKGYEYSSHFRNMDPTLGLNGSHMSRIPSQFSPSTIAISPVDSNTSNETNQTQGTSQEDCGYVSQSSTASIRSMECGFNRMPPDIYRRYERYGHMIKNSPALSRLDQSRSGNAGSKDKKEIDVRQFLQMWNEGEDEGGENNNKEVISKPTPIDTNNGMNPSNYETNNQEQLYVLGLVNVPSEELDKYEHIQKVSKLPENIKGYNSIELLHQFEEVIGSSNLNHYKPATKEFHNSLKRTVPMHGISIPSRPLSPLDVEAKISQSVIHKEVGCNFEIKPCSPKMLNVEVATPARSVIGERMIEKVSNPLVHSPVNPIAQKVNELRDDCNIIKSQDILPTHENLKIASCKMVNKPYGNKDPVDLGKTNYSIQDLESNSGVCLASLPRLDNDIELNFPEVNQQFINANKVDSVITSAPTKDLPSLDIDPSDDINHKQETNIINSDSKNDTDNEFSKLCKYRKLKRNGLETNILESNVQALRTDSVIIKNPDNCKGYDNMENILSPKISNKEAQDDPINLSISTEQCANINTLNFNFRPEEEKPSDFAIDFSINANESCNFANKSQVSVKDNPIKKYDLERVGSIQEDQHKQNHTVTHKQNENVRPADTDYNFDRKFTVCDESISKPKVVNIGKHSPVPQSQDTPKSKIETSVVSPSSDYDQSQKHTEALSTNTSQTMLSSLEKEDALNEKMRELFGEEFTAVESESSLQDLEQIHDTQAILDDDPIVHTAKDCLFSGESSQSNDEMIAGRSISEQNADIESKKKVEQAILDDNAVADTKNNRVFSDESSQSCDDVTSDCSTSEHNVKDKNTTLDAQPILDDDAIKNSEKDKVFTDEFSQFNDGVIADKSMTEQHSIEKSNTNKTIDKEVTVVGEAFVCAGKDSRHSYDAETADCSMSEQNDKEDKSTTIDEHASLEDDVLKKSVKYEVFSDESFRSSHDGVTADCSISEQNDREDKSITIDEQASLDDDVVLKNSEKHKVFSDESSQSSHEGVTADCSMSVMSDREDKSTTIDERASLDDDIVQKKSEKYKAFSDESSQSSHDGATADCSMSQQNAKEESNTMNEQASLDDDDTENSKKENIISDESSQSYVGVTANCSMSEHNAEEESKTTGGQAVLDVDGIANTEKDNKFLDDVSPSYDEETTNYSVCTMSEQIGKEEENATKSEQETANKVNVDKDSSDVNDLLEKTPGASKMTKSCLGNVHDQSQKVVEPCNFYAGPKITHKNGDFSLTTTTTRTIRTYLSHNKKELMSPWIQKLIEHEEGVLANVKPSYVSTVQKSSTNSQSYNKNVKLCTEFPNAVEDDKRFSNVKSDNSAEILKIFKLINNPNNLETSCDTVIAIKSDNIDTQKTEYCAKLTHTSDDYNIIKKLKLDEDPNISRINIDVENSELFKSDKSSKILASIDISNIDKKQENCTEIFKSEGVYKNNSEPTIDSLPEDHKVEISKHTIALKVANNEKHNKKLKIHECSRNSETTDVDKNSNLEEIQKESGIHVNENERIVLSKVLENLHCHSVPETNLKNSNWKDAKAFSNDSPSILRDAIVEDDQEQDKVPEEESDSNIGHENSNRTDSYTSFLNYDEFSRVEIFKKRKNTNLGCGRNTISEKNSDFNNTELADQVHYFSSKLSNSHKEDFDALSRKTFQETSSTNNEMSGQKEGVKELNVEETDSWPDNACVISDFDITTESMEANLLVDTEKQTKPVPDTVRLVDEVKKKECIFEEQILVSDKSKHKVSKYSLLNEPICDTDRNHFGDHGLRLTSDDYNKSIYRDLGITSIQEEKPSIEDSSIVFEGKNMDSLISGSITNECNVLNQFNEEMIEEVGDEVSILHDISNTDVETVNDKPENILLEDSGIILETSGLQIGCEYETSRNIETDETLPLDNCKSMRYSNRYLVKRRKSLKRSLSDSALDEIRDNSSEEPESDLPLWPSKRKKETQINSDNTPHFITENICHVIQNNRRNSISSMQNETICILIDNNCIISEESDKICFSEVPDDCLTCIQEESVNEEESSSEVISFHEDENCEYSTRLDPNYLQDDKLVEESWVEDVACVETVVSDDIAEDVVISATTSPKSDEDDDDETEISNINEHTDKLKIIYGDKMYRDDPHFVDTLYRTPQMNVNKTLLSRESQITDDYSQFNNNILNTEDGSRYYDQESLERLLSEPNVQEYATTDSGALSLRTPLLSPVISEMSPEDDENDRCDSRSISRSDTPIFESKELDIDGHIEKFEDNKSCMNSIIDESKVVKMNCCESSIKDILTYEKTEESSKCTISSSPEVSSTTSEEKNTGILLKITNFGGSMVSQVNDVSPLNRTSCKYTEKKDYLSSNGNLPNRTWITKAAQKYIPPIKETFRDLKVQLPLPQQSLMKLRQLKLAKNALKPNIDKPVDKLRKEIPKKPKPKFEDVLKSIDEIQYQQHKEKNKKVSKKVKLIPKVVIKKSENGSHYASTSGKDKFNPDLTGRKWQPWVFLEKDRFIDKMAVRKKTRAIYNHRKKTFVLAEKFKKYKSICSTKFVISQPKQNDSSSGQLKYTIRLKHSY